MKDIPVQYKKMMDDAVMKLMKAAYGIRDISDELIVTEQKAFIVNDDEITIEIRTATGKEKEQYLECMK